MFCFSRSPVIMWTNIIVKSKFIFQNRFCSETSFKCSTIAKATNFESKSENENLILKNTVVHRSVMVPEIGLHLITPNTKLWNDPYDEGKTFGSDPFWAIFWPGGQSLCRFILDGGPEFPAGNSKFSGKFLAGKRVLDLGCGSGAASIAAVMSGAKKPVFANDIDQIALTSVHLNADANGICRDDIVLSRVNFVEGSIEKNAADLCQSFDVLLVGDMFYDDVIGERVTQLVRLFVEGSNPEQKFVLVGDPGRWYLSQNQITNLKCLCKYHLSEDVKAENFGFDHACVYTYCR